MNIDHLSPGVKHTTSTSPGVSDDSAPNNRQSLPSKDALYSDPARRPAMLPVNWDVIPAALRSLPQWVAWGVFWDGKRWGKVPLDVTSVSTTGYGKAKSNKPYTWRELDRVRAAWGKTYGDVRLRLPEPDGPGFVFKDGGGMLGIDVDRCRNPQTGELSSVAVNIIGELPGYWEASPSGTGIKGFFVGQLPEGQKTHKAMVGDGPEEVEAYDKGRFFCVTGQRVDGAAADVTSCETALPTFLATYLPTRTAPAKRATADHPVTSRAPSTVDYSRSNYSRSVRKARARGWLRARPPAVENRDGDTFTFLTCGSVLVGFDLEFDDAFELLKEWNERCQPPWNLYGTGANSLERKLRESEKWTGGARGCKLTEREVDTPEPLAAGTEADEDESDEDESAAKVAADVLFLLTPADYCPDPRILIGQMKSTGVGCSVPFGCHRGDCPHCGREKKSDLFRETVSYLTRLTEPDAPNGGMRLYAQVVAPDEVKEAQRATRELSGKYLTIPTTDSQGCAEYLVPEPSVNLRQVEEGEACLKLTDGVLALALVPSDTVPDPAFRPVALADAFRAMGNALTTTPPRPEGVKRYRSWNSSRGWGDKIAREPGDFLPDHGKAILKQYEIKAVIADLGIGAPVPVAERTAQAPPVGWQAPPAAKIALSLLFRGESRPEHLRHPTADRITALAGYWIKVLPPDLGDGPEVETVLRKHLWTGPPWGVIDELRATDAADRENAPRLAEERLARVRLDREADEITRALRRAYPRGRKRNQASELVRMLLARTPKRRPEPAACTA
jgi:hypothetical protein